MGAYAGSTWPQVFPTTYSHCDLVGRVLLPLMKLPDALITKRPHIAAVRDLDGTHLGLHRLPHSNQPPCRSSKIGNRPVQTQHSTRMLRIRGSPSCVGFLG